MRAFAVLLLAAGVVVLTVAGSIASAQTQTPQTVTKAGTSANNAVGVQGVTGGVPVAISGTISATAVEASVTSTGNNVPGQATYIGGVDAAGKLRGLPMSTSTPAASDLALVVRMPSGASGLTDGELRAAPVAVSSTLVGAGTATTTPLYVVTTNSSSLSGSIGVTQSSTPWVVSVPSGVTSTFGGIPQPMMATQSSTPWFTSVITGVTSTIVGPLGQTTMAASVPVTLASNQGVISVTSTSSQLPAALGQTTMAASLPVTLASNQGTISVTSTSSQLPAALGQTTMAASLPVTLASNQGTISVTSTSSQLPASLGQKAMSASFPVVIASDNSVTTTAAAYGSEGVKLSTANSGRLQVDVITGGGSNASVGTVTSTVPTSATQIGGWSTGGQLLVPFVMTSTPAGAEPGLVVRMPAGSSGLTNTELRASGVGVTQSSTPWVTITNDVQVVGTLGAAGAGVTSTLNGMVGVAFSITATSTLVGTLTPAVSIDGTTWTTTAFLDYDGSATTTLVVATSTAYQRGIALLGGARYARVLVTSYTSGTANAFIVASMSPNLGNATVTTPATSQGASLSGVTGHLIQAAVTSTVTYTDGTVRPPTLSTDGTLRVDTLAGYSTTSTVNSTATTLFQLITGSAGNKVYIKNWKCSASVASSTTADNQCVLKYGTGTACGTGTVAIDGCFQPANGGCNGGDLVIPAAQNVCWIHAATGNKTVTITYRIAP